MQQTDPELAAQKRGNLKGKERKVKGGKSYKVDLLPSKWGNELRPTLKGENSQGNKSFARNSKTVSDKKRPEGRPKKGPKAGASRRDQHRAM